ncbi:iron-sulfur cluster assembly scaffold protein [Arenimonas alkanexedens]
MDDTPTFSALYRNRVLDHGRTPRHVGTLADASHRASAHNALCGDRIAVELRLGPAVANALSALTGQRLRELPLRLKA